MDGREIELKLALTPDDMTRLAGRPCLVENRRGEPALKHLSSLYFDTPDFTLAAQGISVRVRKTGDGHVQTVKTAGTAISGLFDRDEWEVPLTSPRLDPEQLRVTGLAALCEDDVAERLVPAFATEIKRTIYRLGGDDWEVEAALDIGEVVAGELSEPICEIELELVRGAPAHLFVLARQVQEEVAARPMSLSKSDRGFRLASGHAAAPIKARAPLLTTEMSVTEAFQTIARSCLDHLLLNERCLLATGDGEAIHQMRVALRRLRSASKVFRGILASPQSDEIKGDMRWLLEHLGPARDADVFLNEIIDPVLAQHPDNKGLKALHAFWSKDRDLRLNAAINAVRSRRYCALVLRLGQWVETGDWLGTSLAPPRRKLAEPVSSFAGRRLIKGVRKLLRLGGDNPSKLSPENQHAVRIQCKQVRYSGEFFAALVPRKHMKVFLAELSELQDVLGQLNDIAVAGPKLSGKTSEPGSSRAAGLVAGWHQARRSSLLSEVDKAWKRWRACPVPWQDG
ncbi:MAG: CHAD domain-containing protein [Magnetospirillum sp.]|nr:CHAD domain-containing protein [Magnetospirillum sp.]